MLTSGVCSCGWTKVYSEERPERNANVGKWPALPVSYRLLARTHTLVTFFLKIKIEGD